MFHFIKGARDKQIDRGDRVAQIQWAEEEGEGEPVHGYIFSHVWSLAMGIRILFISLLRDEYGEDLAHFF